MMWENDALYNKIHHRLAIAPVQVIKTAVTCILAAAIILLQHLIHRAGLPAHVILMQIGMLRRTAFCSIDAGQYGVQAAYAKRQLVVFNWVLPKVQTTALSIAADRLPKQQSSTVWHPDVSR